MPRRAKDPDFVHLDPEGRNGGMPAPAHEYLTPSARIFTRSHGAVPIIDGAAWRLAVAGLVEQPLLLSLGDLRERFPIHDLTATLICAGLRREEFLRLTPLPGELAWGGQPVANARWRGVLLSDVLAAAGVAPGAGHIQFSGLDEIERHGERFAFGGSIPVEKARDSGVLLAFELDGRPLPPDHGFPLRVVVPGWIGARSVKWLGRIEASEVASTNYFRTHAYRFQRNVNPADPRDVTDGDPIEAVALNSMITTPAPGAELRAGVVTVAGWAIGPEGTSPALVEVSADGGSSWRPANIEPAGEMWTWRLWSLSIMLPPGSHELVVRARDTAGNLQPEDLGETWNVKGYANNAWHRLPVSVVP